VEVLVSSGGILHRYDLNASGNIDSQSTLDFSPLLSPGRPYLLDLDQDGDLDIHMSGNGINGTSYAVLTNDGTGSFSGCLMGNGLAHGFSAAGDLNADGLIDFTSFSTCSYCSSTVHVLIQDP